ncbi:FadR/GntR family transcriptional regulator [Schlesneria paludicola]|uniref:FadR/GntR family transcriptional regulator n=1 Tax=Schlesneria paludicola TaxID=360056 RepID=UPI00029B2FB4|nr:FCD domain-containing protein [Schlesneria paludicola]
MPKELRQNRSQQLADRIRQQIEQDKLPDGELFMTEAEVAEKFEVSRTVAREAVGRLRAIGLLEGRQRKGLIVRHPDPVRLFSASLPSLARSEENMVELARFRYVLEVGAIELAVKNATDEQVDRLLVIAGEIKNTVNDRSGMKKQTKLDIAFHSLLLEMTGSPFIAGMQRVLIDFFRSIAVNSPPDAANAERIGWEHTELAAAIRDGDVERARAMIRVQVRRYLPEAELGNTRGRQAAVRSSGQNPPPKRTG